ncbi:T9SS type A sorting domain-containing protein [candidate division WOR-3 bacterium]|nr:T9SS type A sorting domain-containing protein [candidate division WOR-3 bacterium]
MKNRLGFIILFCIFAISLTVQTVRSDSIERLGACATPGSADGVFTQGWYSYIADRGGLTSIDISAPETPTVCDFLDLEWPTGVFVIDTLAFLNGALAGPAFAIINISDPTNLSRISWILIPEGGIYCKGIMVVDTLVYLADGSAGFLIINVGDLLNPTILSTVNTSGYVYDLYVKDSLAFLADFNSLLIVNVSDPFNPVAVGSLSVNGGGAYDVWVAGNYAFVTKKDYLGGHGKVNMIDISDPMTPTFVKQVSMNATPYGLFVVNDKVYVAADDWWAPPRKKGEGRADIEGGIRVVHWEEPDSMNLLVSFDTPGRCRDIFVVDSFIYIADRDSFMIYKYVSTGIAENKKKSPETTSSFITYPNPFSKQTQISFSISSNSFASLEIYDERGRRVRDLAGGYLVPGKYKVIWDGVNNNAEKVTSGVYFVKLMTKSGMIRIERQKKVIYINERRQR